MNGVFKLVRKDKIAKWGFTLSNIFVVFEIIAIGIFYFSLPPFIPIFNQMPWGEMRLGIKPAIFIPIAITILFIGVNFFMVGRLYEKTPLLSRILSITTLLATLLSFIFILRTVYLLI
jgi:hypothetical protein